MVFVRKGWMKHLCVVVACLLSFPAPGSLGGTERPTKAATSVTDDVFRAMLAQLAKAQKVSSLKPPAATIATFEGQNNKNKKNLIENNNKERRVVGGDAVMP